MELKLKKIGKLLPLGDSFTAYANCVLYSVTIFSPIDCKTSRFIGFSSHESFEMLSLENKMKVLFKSELSKDELSLILTEYEIIKTCKDNEQ